jgi:catechol 2,3-dioxygenase-like lactoylglutathione lyase family enzyme
MTDSKLSPTALDHVALWVDDREPLAAFLCDHLGMHEIDKTDKFTLLGADARRGKLTLFDAEGPREPGVLERVVLRVADLEAALRALPGDLAVERRNGVAAFDGPADLGLGLVEATGEGPDYDLDHVVLRVPDPEATATGLEALGFTRDGDRLTVTDKHVRLERGGAHEGERPLLNHLALLVDSAGAVEDEARARDLDVADVVDAANTLAVFVWGPDRIKLEYVEHKPSFSLV